MGAPINVLVKKGLKVCAKGNKGWILDEAV